MKRVSRMMILMPIFTLVGCKSMSDFMKYPPGPEQLWSKQGVTIMEMLVDRKGCHDQALKLGIESARDRRIYTEGCLLNMGYIFTNYLSRDTADYCSKDWYGGGPACKSVGR
jgi:hypothetical protein